ncbi:MAG: DnaJ domain-containing protein [Candidatus Eiseniibacteriota bacterium]
MGYLLLGIAALFALYIVARLFVAAQPAQLASALRLFVMVASGGLGLFFAATGRLSWAIPAFAVFAGVAARAGGLWRWGGGGASSDGRSSVDTAYLRMTLDHGSGAMDGTVLKGPFQGRALSALSLEALLALLEECRVEDPPSARVLEAYLDRIEPKWRERGDGAGAASGAGPGGQRRSGGSSAPPPGRNRMTRQEALELLGLEKSATPEQIKEAHRRLMNKNHPDKGGSTYLAAKINEAKEVLLGH